MKHCIKYLIVIALSLILSPIVFANSINTDDLDFNKMRFSPTENSVAYNYINTYAKQLNDNINFKKFRRYWLAHYCYILNPDGTISNLRALELNTPKKNKKINAYFENIIQTTSPPPFPENMEIGAVRIELYISRDNDEDDIDCIFLKRDPQTVLPGNYISIYIDKNG